MGRERFGTKVGSVELKNPLIAAAAEHFIEPEGICRAIAAGAGAVVVKSTNDLKRQRISCNALNMPFLMKSGGQ